MVVTKKLKTELEFDNRVWETPKGRYPNDPDNRIEEGPTAQIAWWM